MFFKRLVTAFQMLSVVLAAFTLALLFLKDPPPLDTATAGSAPGAALFATNCASCHGPLGDGASAPRLVGAVVDRYPNVDDQLAVVRDGKGLMPAFGGQLRADELRQVVDFTRRPASTTVAAGGAIDAKAIYTARCAGCHDADGSGTYLNGVSFVGGAMRVKYPEVNDQISVVLRGRGDMKPFEGILSAEEIKAVVEYTRSQL